MNTMTIDVAHTSATKEWEATRRHFALIATEGATKFPQNAPTGTEGGLGNWLDAGACEATLSSNPQMTMVAGGGMRHCTQLPTRWARETWPFYSDNQRQRADLSTHQGRGERTGRLRRGSRATACVVKLMPATNWTNPMKPSPNAKNRFPAGQTHENYRLEEERLETA